MSGFRAAALLLAAIAGVRGAAGAEATVKGRAAGEPPADRIVEQGIAVETTLAPLAANAEAKSLQEGTDVLVRFRISEARTGRPLAGLAPAAWLDLLPPGEVSGPQWCSRRVKELAAGSLFTQATIDLNVYHVLAMNDDASVSVVDPHFSFGGSRLVAMVPLLAPGEDWALAADQRTLFVSQPLADRVAVVATDSWKVTVQLDVGRHPSRVALQPDGGYLWVSVEGGTGADNQPGVTVVDVRRLEVVARLATGKGEHDIAFSGDSAYAFVTNRDDGTVAVIDVRRLEKVASLATGSRPVSVAFSQKAQAAYVAHEGDGDIVAVDGARRAIVARLAATAGVRQIRFAPDGRLGFVINPRAETLQVFDAAVNRILQAGKVQPQPDQLSFSSQLAYVRHSGSDTVLMIPWREVGHPGQPLPVADFSGGQHPFGQGRRASLAAGIVPAPGGGAVLVANPADRAIYYYREGMAAPVGSFSNYGREPRALLVVDRSLGEKTRPGTYETVTRLHGAAGSYQVVLFVDSPRLMHCLAVEVLPSPELERQRRQAAPVAVEPLPAPAMARTGIAVHLRFRLTEVATGKPRSGVRDLVAMVFPISGAWEERHVTTQVGEGLYQATFVPPVPGRYEIVVESPSQRLFFHLSPRLLLDVPDGGR